MDLDNADEFEEDESLDFAWSLFFKSKAKNKKPRVNTLKKCEAGAVEKLAKHGPEVGEKTVKKSSRKKAKGSPGVD